MINAEPGDVPFAVAFTSEHRVEVAEAGNNDVATFALGPWGDLTRLYTSATGQTATCWITVDGDHSYASNAGSGTVTGFSRSSSGALTLVGNTDTDPGTVDSAIAPGGAYLHVRAGLNGNLDEFEVNADGSLTSIGSLTVANAAGGEGIAVS